LRKGYHSQHIKLGESKNLGYEPITKRTTLIFGLKGHQNQHINVCKCKHIVQQIYF